MSSRYTSPRPPFVLTLTLCLAAGACARQAPDYPLTRKDTVVDDYFGTQVADPYRWLEDQNSPEVATWVEEENAVTFAYLDKIPLRTAFGDRLTELWNTPSVTVPSHIAGRLFYRMNTGLQNQSVLYDQTDVGGEPTQLIDPNSLSPDGSVRPRVGFAVPRRTIPGVRPFRGRLRLGGAPRP